MNDARPLVQVQGLRKSFPTAHGPVDVLRQVDLEIAVGERVAVVGASGSGKTTLMHLLGGLDRPTAGSVLYAGDDLYRLDAAALDRYRNATMGFVFQFHQLLPEFSALENVMLPGLIARLRRQEVEERARALLADVGLEHRLHHKPGALSGGEQQRVAIARALSRSPRVLLADEPTGNLDSRTSDTIMALLARLHAEYRLTMVVVTHSKALAGQLDRIVHMVDGRLQAAPPMTS